MNAHYLPIAGIPCNTEKDYLGDFTDISGKRILCIGYAESEVEDLVKKYDPASITMLTNWVDHKDAQASKYPLVIGDITTTTAFADDTFDTIVTLSVLEHLSNLPGAAKEMTRIVKAGGEHLHFFGPAWSSAYGHHIYAQPGDRLLDFCQWAMPAHIHLLCDKNEISQYYSECGYSQPDILRALGWFYETPLINRAFYDGYTRLFAECFQIDAMQLMYNQLPLDHLKQLRAKFPGVLDFSTYGGKFKLKVVK